MPATTTTLCATLCAAPPTHTHTHAHAEYAARVPANANGPQCAHCGWRGGGHASNCPFSPALAAIAFPFPPAHDTVIVIALCMYLLIKFQEELKDIRPHSEPSLSRLTSGDLNASLFRTTTIRRLPPVLQLELDSLLGAIVLRTALALASREELCEKKLVDQRAITDTAKCTLTAPTERLSSSDAQSRRSAHISTPKYDRGRTTALVRSARSAPSVSTSSSCGSVRPTAP
ncbi:hypothetical protein B0H15DRAFT_933950, partial [Mycena belliarum]